MRLEKYLSDCGIGTRSQCKTYIRQGLIKVNQEIVKNGATQITQEDSISFRDAPLILQQNLYYMFHKPAGCICATKDEKQKTVLEYFPKELSKRLLIVGRLDKDTEGLLFLTDDGAFVHQMMSPKKHIEKTYYFKAYGKLPQDAPDMVAQGISIGDETNTLPGRLEQTKESESGGLTITDGYLTICEGRYHQVKRMLKAMGCEVFYLKRLSIGAITLDKSLAAGSYRALTDKELQMLGIESRK
jgi:16S rRNA pseudouridine516 synthase